MPDGVRKVVESCLATGEVREFEGVLGKGVRARNEIRVLRGGVCAPVAVIEDRVREFCHLPGGYLKRILTLFVL
jgi:hypothetical protein